ncbi:hypothetical protein Pmani_001102 [Petrolisthes manimaculis]|uniref:Uncharacterized protein n=1 Tax=Petrolisthes manimaculis TaxID=1843537 RepID=A0AAE1UKM5_9EUCA|nr:hypothetical protein Pmani_001102 [Petrolisthes manimaculis]
MARARRHPGQGVSPTGPATCLPGPAPPADSGMPRGMKPVGLRLVSDSVKVLVWRAAAGARPVPTATVIFKCLPQAAFGFPGNEWPMLGMNEPVGRAALLHCISGASMG